MKRLTIALLVASAATPALAQHADHGGQDPHAGHAAQSPAPAQADPHAGHAAPAQQPTQPDPHAGHNMPAQQPAQPDPHAGHNMPARQPAQPNPHAGHNMPAQQPTQPDPQAGHGGGGQPAPPVAPPPPAAGNGPANAADRFYPPVEMAQARAEMNEEHGGMSASRFLVDQLEARIRDGRDGYAWDAQFWYGGDIDKLWLKTEGEGAFGESIDAAEVQALWSHAIDPWFDLQLGVRHDFRPNPERTHLVLGVQGLAPYWFEVDGALFLSNKGDVTARFEAEYDLRLTQRLILQPLVEVDAALQDVPELGIGSGISNAEAALRLRYQIAPEFAPYIGVHYERSFGDTARFRRAAGEDAGGWSLLAGIRTWF